jgi:hypothetical protein
MSFLDWLLKIIIIWLCLDVVIIATGWFLTNTISSRYPDWWRRMIVDKDPRDY